MAIPKGVKEVERLIERAERELDHIRSEREKLVEKESTIVSHHAQLSELRDSIRKPVKRKARKAPADRLEIPTNDRP